MRWLGATVAFALLWGCGATMQNPVAPDGGAGGAGTGGLATGAGGAGTGGAATGAGGATGGGAGTGGAGPRDAAADRAGAGGAAGCEAGADACVDARMTCDIVTCFRAVNCVAVCGGPVLVSSCCPCAPPTFDSIQCNDSSLQ